MQFTVTGMDPAIEYENLMNQNQMAEVGRNAIYDSFKDGKTYMEWGSGGSTLWYLKQFKEKYKKGTKIISVEHDPNWYNKVFSAVGNYFEKDELPKEAFNYQQAATMQYQMSDGKPFNIISTPFEENPAFCTRYIQPEGIDISEVDVFLVDGLARGACLAMLAMKAKPGAVIFLHDIKGREPWYEWGCELLKTRSKISFVYDNLMRFDVENIIDKFDVEFDDDRMTDPDPEKY